jgi:glycosyltransferase involved in cell wall biosynthesis
MSARDVCNLSRRCGCRGSRAERDGTRELLQSGEVKGVDRLILLDSNRGKGAALRAGIRVATGDVVVIQDADLEYDPKYFKMFRREVLQALTTEEDRFGWDPEVVAKIARLKLRIKEVPIS